MKKTFAVIGLGRFGLSIFKELVATNQDVIGIDKMVENVRKASEFSDKVFVCDSTDQKSLIDLGFKNVDHAIISIPSSLQASILTIILLKELKIGKITVRTDDELFGPVYLKLGATDTINPQEIAGMRLANKVVSDNFNDYFQIEEDFGVTEIVVSENFKVIDIETLNPRNKYNVNLMIIKRKGAIFTPNRKTTILPNDVLFVFGKKHDLIKFGMLVGKN